MSNAETIKSLVESMQQAQAADGGGIDRDDAKLMQDLSTAVCVTALRAHSHGLKSNLVIEAVAAALGIMLGHNSTAEQLNPNIIVTANIIHKAAVGAMKP